MLASMAKVLVELKIMALSILTVLEIPRKLPHDTSVVMAVMLKFLT